MAKNTVVTTKPASVPVIRLPRQRADVQASAAVRERVGTSESVAAHSWGAPTEIPATSAYRHLVIAYGSNFGANKELAERFAERGEFHGYTSDVLTLNELAESPPRTEPWLLVVMTSTYTSNPPPNATAFKVWLERSEPGAATWRGCRYLVWGLGNSQWNAFLAFPRYVDTKLSELGAARLADLGYGDVGSPVWERLHADWNGSCLAGPPRALRRRRRPRRRPQRVAAERAAAGVLTGADSNTAMAKSLRADAAPRVLLVPTILSNAVGTETVEARAAVCRELQAAAVARNGRAMSRSACRAVSPTRRVTTSASARRTTRRTSSGSHAISAPSSTACSWSRRP